MLAFANVINCSSQRDSSPAGSAKRQCEFPKFAAAFPREAVVGNEAEVAIDQYGHGYCIIAGQTHTNRVPCGHQDCITFIFSHFTSFIKYYQLRAWVFHIELLHTFILLESVSLQKRYPKWMNPLLFAAETTRKLD